MSLALFTYGYILTPVLILWGWFRLIRHGDLRERTSWLSFVALLLATCSGLWAIGTVSYARAAGGFAYFDPRLFSIYRVGLLLSSLAVVAGFVGLPFRNPLRWQAPAASFGVLLFWVMAAMTL